MTLKYQAPDKATTRRESTEVLKALATELEPRDFIQRLAAYVLTTAGGQLEIVDVDNETEGGWLAAARRAQRAAEAVGKEAVVRTDLGSAILPRVLRKGLGRQRSFGYGLALGSGDRDQTWEELCRAFFALSKEERSVEVLCGYIAQLREKDQALANSLLDSAANNSAFDAEFPLLNGCFDIDEKAAARLSSATKKRIAKASTYMNLSFGRREETVSPATFRRLVNDISSLDGGFSVAIHLLGMRMHILTKSNLDAETIALAHELVPRCPYDDRDGNLDYHVGETIRACFRGREGAEPTKAACAAFVASLASECMGAWSYVTTAQALFEVQPEIALDSFFGAKDRYGRSALRRMDIIAEDGPVNRVPLELLKEWARGDFASRLPWLAENVRLFAPGADGTLNWTPAAQYVLDNASHPATILATFARRLLPTSWSGSRADILAPRVRLLEDFAQHPQSDVRAWAAKEGESMRRAIEKERALDRKTDQSFEPE
jgi:hypothetical protein